MSTICSHIIVGYSCCFIGFYIMEQCIRLPFRAIRKLLRWKALFWLIQLLRISKILESARGSRGNSPAPYLLSILLHGKFMRSQCFATLLNHCDIQAGRPNRTGHILMRLVPAAFFRYNIGAIQGNNFENIAALMAHRYTNAGYAGSAD